MKRNELNNDDRVLVDIAIETAKKLYLNNKHEVASALKTASGETYTGIHIESSLGWPCVCGEVSAMCKMVSDGRRDLDTIVAIWQNEKEQHFVLPPCGRCRELISDFNPNAMVIVSKEDNHWGEDSINNLCKVMVKDLLPLKAL